MASTSRIRAAVKLVLPKDVFVRYADTLLKVPHMAWFLYQVHGDRFTHSSNIKVITETISGAAVLVLLMGGTYEVCLRWHNIHIKFHGDTFRHSSNIMIITSTIAEATYSVGNTDGRDL
jgi:hypothetical protein